MSEWTGDEVRRHERERIAEFIEKGRFAPVDYGGCCLECKEWTPPNHPERWGHLDSCSWASKEFYGDSYIANLIRNMEEDEEV
jgi:hypothetical protein